MKFRNCLHLAFWLAMFAAGALFLASPLLAQTPPAPAITAGPVVATPAVVTTQPLAVAVSLAGTPAPTGSVTLTALVANSSGSPVSTTTAAVLLASGSASITVPAGLASGTVLIAYTPDAASAKLYAPSTVAYTVEITAAPSAPPTSSAPIPSVQIGVPVAPATAYIITLQNFDFIPGISPGGWQFSCAAPTAVPAAQ